MKCCKKCCHLTEVVGGNNLVYWCKIRNEEIYIPQFEGRFCDFYKEVKNERNVK